MNLGNGKFATGWRRACHCSRSHSLLAASVFRGAKPCENLSKGEGGHKDLSFFPWIWLGRYFFSIKLQDRLITLELSGKAGFVGLI